MYFKRFFLLLSMLFVVSSGFGASKPVSKDFFEFIEQCQDEQATIQELEEHLKDKDAVHFLNQIKSVCTSDPSDSLKFSQKLTSVEYLITKKKFVILKWLVEHKNFDLNQQKVQHNNPGVYGPLYSFLVGLKENHTNKEYLTAFHAFLDNQYKKIDIKDACIDLQSSNNHQIWQKISLVNNELLKTILKQILDKDHSLQLLFFENAISSNNKELVAFMLEAYGEFLKKNQELPYYNSRDRTPEERNFLDLPATLEIRKMLIEKGINEASKETRNSWSFTDPNLRSKIKVTHSWNHQRTGSIKAIIVGSLIWDIIAYKKKKEKKENASMTAEETKKEKSGSDLRRLYNYVNTWRKDVWNRPMKHTRFFIPTLISLSIYLLKDMTPGVRNL